jgi:hypothetical protein
MSSKWSLFFIITLSLVVAVCFFYIIKGSADLRDLRRESRQTIANLEKEKAESKKREGAVEKEARELLAALQAAKGRIDEAISERDRYRKERDVARRRVEEMSLAQVRDRTTVILKITEITLSDGGLLFSEAASKINLVALEEGITAQGLLEKEQRLSFEWQGRAESAEKIIVKKDFIIDEKDIQLRAEERVNEELRRQFLIERSLREAAKLRAFLFGAGGGAALTALLILLTGGK